MNLSCRCKGWGSKATVQLWFRINSVSKGMVCVRWDMLDICERERGAKKVWSAKCFSNFNLGMLLYLVLFSVWVILILLSILFSQISKWYSCIYLTSALFSLLCHRGFVRFTFPCLFQVLYCGVAHIFISFISFVAHRCTYILAKKCSCQCYCNFHHCSYFLRKE